VCTVLSLVEDGTQHLHYCCLGEVIRDDPIPIPVSVGDPENQEIAELVERCQQLVEKK
jgi:hypothetical protein